MRTELICAGWLVICGWQGILAGSGYLCGTMIEALIQLNHSSYTPQRWEGTLLFWATVVVAVLINTVASRLLPPIEAFILVVHILGFFAILIPIVYMAPQKASTHEVFTVFQNGGNWPSQGLSFFIGIVGSVFAMFGCDSAVHMAEEVRNADWVVPWSMLVTTLLNGALGFGIVAAMLYVTIDIDAVLESPTGVLGFPFMQIFYDATGSKGGTSAMIAIIIVMVLAALLRRSRRLRGLFGPLLVTEAFPSGAT